MIRRLAAVLLAMSAVAGLAARAGADTPPAGSPITPVAATPSRLELSPARDQVAALARPVTVASLDDATRGTTELVGTTMPDPHPLPADSGTGRRAVFSISQQFVWAVEADGRIAHSFLVSARLDMPRPGTYRVFSRSEFTCSRSNWNECMRWMVRFTKGPEGDNIGFHEIPRIKGVPVQTEEQLGQPLSAGCLRESTTDAWFMWLWAPIGTTVVVVP